MQFENPESTFFSVTWTIFCSGIIHPSLGNQIIKDKSLGKTPIWVILCFSPLPPTSQCWGTKSKTCVKQCYGFTTLYRGRGGGLLNMLCEIPIIFCHWLSEFYKKKKKKNERGEMPKLLLFPAVIIWHLSENCYYYKHTMTNITVWLSCYVAIYIFVISSYLTTINQCLTKFVFQEWCAIVKIFRLH